MGRRLTVLSRKCGACVECCRVMSIRELAKPVHTDCAHQRPGGGCAIYENRPPSCREWSCDWLIGRVGTEGDRPDKIGAIFWNATGTVFADLADDKGLVIMESTGPGAITPRAFVLAKEISLARLVFIRETQAVRRMVGPQDLLEIVSERTGGQPLADDHGGTQ